MFSAQKEGSSGPWIVLLHWLGGSARTWAEVSRVAAKRGYRVAALDLPGFGEAADLDGYTVEAMSDVVVEAVGSLRLEDDAQGVKSVPWLLGGHSMGGKVAAVVARRALDGEAGLEGLQGLFLVSPSPPGPEPMPGSKRDDLLKKLGTSTGDARTDRGRARSFVEDNTGEMRLPAASETLAEDDLLRMNRAAFRHWLTEGSKEDWSSRVGILPLPALLLAGTKDAALGPEAQREHTLPHFRSAEVVSLAGGSHLAPLERPEEVALRLLDFAKRIGLEPVFEAALLEPRFQALIDGPLTSQRTKSLMESRLGGTEDALPPQVFGHEAFFTLAALVECVVPEAPFNLAARLDGMLAFGVGDGWRLAALPEDREAWRKGLRSLDHAAMRIYRVPFIALPPELQSALLAQACAGTLGRGVLGNVGVSDSADGYSGAEMKQWFEEARGELAKLYLSDPRTMQRVGFKGFADEAGFTQIRLGETEEFER